MLSQEEATKILMEELGYRRREAHSTYYFALSDGDWKAAWEEINPPKDGSERMSDKQALVYCLDPYVHIGIGEKHQWSIALIIPAKVAEIHDGHNWTLISDAKSKVSIQEACFIALAEALKKGKEK